MKTILEELKEGFEELKKSEAEKVYTAIENREFPPLVMNPITVSKMVNRVLMNHKMTLDELLVMSSQRDISPEEWKMIAELKHQEQIAEAQENAVSEENADA